MLLNKCARDKEKGFCSEVPAEFISLEQARNSLDYHWNNCIDFLNQLETNLGYEGIGGHGPLDVLRTSETVRHEMFDVNGRWLVAFQAFLQKDGQMLDSRGLQAARILEISHSLAMLFLNVTTVGKFNDETVWDRFTERFEHIVRLAVLVIESLTSDKSTSKKGPNFTLDMHTVAPLYAVAHRCRHPSIRRKAVALLYAVPRQEGVWDSVITARVAERLIGIEESGLGSVTCCEDVPDWARISDVEVNFVLHERMGTVRYSRQRSPLEKVRETFTEVVRW